MYNAEFYMYWYPHYLVSSSEANSKDEPKKSEAAHDEVFCTSCGEVIKEKAEICPECGVRQIEPESSQSDIEGKLDDLVSGDVSLQELARKDINSVMIWSFLFTPVGYLKVGRTDLAALNFLTLNFFLLGPIVVPFHTRKMIKDARAELERQGKT